MEKLKKTNGITLIALIVTIIVLLILAGVSIAMLTGENGILTQAKKAEEETEIANEKEAIQLEMINKEINNKKEYIGEELKDRTLANGDNWKIVSANDTNKIYGTGYYFVETGTNLENYGATKYEWVINYDTGEVTKLEKDEYTKLAYGDNLAVKDNIILNVDPINMSDENSWGEGVTVYGITEGDGYGWNKSEFKLDGVDDYIEVYPQEDIKIDEGITFEFYGKSYSSILQMLSKTIKNASQDHNYNNRFRTRMENSNFLCCMSNRGCGSDWVWSDATHWIKKSSIGSMQSQNGGYLTMSIDIKNDKISIYWEGSFIDSTICSHEWLIGGDLLSGDIPFTVGLQVYGNSNGEREEGYSKVDIYACRLYNKVLTAGEIKNNYNATVAYHNLLVNSK